MKTVQLLMVLMMIFIPTMVYPTSKICPAFERYSCYKAEDGKSGQDIFPQLLFSDRLQTSSKHKSNRNGVDWKNWNTYLQDIACRCAESARKYGYHYFGIQFYGECWSGPLSDANLGSLVKSEKCFGKDFQPCSPNTDFHCAGGSNVNFIYRMQNAGQCGKNPCQNGGKCIEGVNAYTCKCPAGYTGKNCETNIDECAKDPCQNCGNCIDGVNSFTCECLPGYTGNTCEIDIDDCAKKPCQYGGQCIDGVNSYTCKCKPGYTGINCENPPVCHKVKRLGCFISYVGWHRSLPDLILTDRDESSPANSGQTMDWDNWGNYMADIACRCAKKAKGLGYKIIGIQNYGECWGSRSVKEEEFGSRIASNDNCGGIDFVKCLPEEKHCVGLKMANFVYQLAYIDDCAKKPCQNGGQCIDGDNSYTCKCKPGYTGINCENPPVCHKVKRLGCFISYVGWHRSLPDLILTDRDESSPANSGHIMDWDNWGNYMADIACRCAKKAKGLGYKIIGIQNYGECWGSRSVKEEEFGSRIASNDNCGGIDFVKCLPEEKHCVGLKMANFVYQLVEQPEVE